MGSEIVSAKVIDLDVSPKESTPGEIFNLTVTIINGTGGSTETIDLNVSLPNGTIIRIAQNHTIVLDANGAGKATYTFFNTNLSGIYCAKVYNPSGNTTVANLTYFLVYAVQNKMRSVETNSLDKCVYPLSYQVQTKIITTNVLTVSVLNASINVTPDKLAYDPGDFVNILGEAMFPGARPASNATLRIEVKDPLGLMIYDATLSTDHNGAFSTGFALPTNAASGIYTINVSAIDGHGIRGFKSSQFVIGDLQVVVITDRLVYGFRAPQGVSEKVEIRAMILYGRGIELVTWGALQTFTVTYPSGTLGTGTLTRIAPGIFQAFFTTGATGNHIITVTVEGSGGRIVSSSTTFNVVTWGCYGCHPETHPFKAIPLSPPSYDAKIVHSIHTSLRFFGCGPACHTGTTLDCTNCHTNFVLEGDHANVPGATRDAQCLTCHNPLPSAVPRTCDDCHRNTTYPAPQIPGARGETHAGNVSCDWCHGETHGMVTPPFDPIHMTNCSQCHPYKYYSRHAGNYSEFLEGRAVSCVQCHDNVSLNYTGTMFPIGIYHTNTSIHVANLSEMIIADVTPYKCFPCHFVILGESYVEHGINCENCHRGLDGRAAEHSEIITMAGPDCIACHGLAGPARARVDVSAMNATHAVHRLLNNRTAVNVSWENERCWACHGDDTNRDGIATEAEQPIDRHAARYRTPRDCEDCHVGTAKFNAPLIFEHYVGADDIKAYMPCSVCHRNSHNVHLNPYIDIPAGELDGRVAHYADTLLRTGCRECHQDANVSAMYGRATLVYAHDKLACEVCHVVPRTTITSLHDEDMWIPRLTCAECHTIEHWVLQYQVPGQIISHYPRAPSGAGNTLFMGYDCMGCHGNAPIHSANLTTTRWGCADCHTPNGTGKIARHTPSIEPYSHGNITCEGCHAVDQRFHFTPLALGDVALPGWANWMPGRTTDCVDCHVDHAGETFDTPDAATMRASHASPTTNCTVCHGTDLISMHDDGGTDGCGWCHNPTVHYVQSPDDTGCFTCHVEFVPDSQTAHDVELADRYTCASCHRYHWVIAPIRGVDTPYGWFASVDSPYLPADEIHMAHDGDNPWAFFPTCAPCHGNIIAQRADCDKCHAALVVAPTPTPMPTPTPTSTSTPTPVPTPPINWVPIIGGIIVVISVIAAAYIYGEAIVNMLKGLRRI